ncbi:MarR family transcriptional regulator [Vibrio sp.]|uniref:MarR family transcriptional regulator n=1 Tax=Vibrio sp. TaxID=678 RepID=UPI003D0F630B
MNHTDSCNTEQLQPDIIIKRILESCNSNIVLLQQTLNELPESDSDCNSNLLQSLPSDFLFQWMSLLCSDTPQVYPALIHFLKENDFCYASGIEKVLGYQRQNVRKYLANLEKQGIVRRMTQQETNEIESLILAHKQAYNLTEYHIRKAQFYTLTEYAKTFFNQLDWHDILEKTTIHQVKNWKHRLARTHKQVENARKQQQKDLRRDAQYYHQRKNNPMITEEQHASWFAAKAKNHGMTVDEFKQQLESLLS